MGVRSSGRARRSRLGKSGSGLFILGAALAVLWILRGWTRTRTGPKLATVTLPQQNEPASEVHPPRSLGAQSVIDAATRMVDTLDRTANLTAEKALAFGLALEELREQAEVYHRPLAQALLGRGLEISGDLCARFARQLREKAGDLEEQLSRLRKEAAAGLDRFQKKVGDFKERFGELRTLAMQEAIRLRASAHRELRRAGEHFDRLREQAQESFLLGNAEVSARRFRQALLEVTEPRLQRLSDRWVQEGLEDRVAELGALAVERALSLRAAAETELGRVEEHLEWLREQAEGSLRAILERGGAELAGRLEASAKKNLSALGEKVVRVREQAENELLGAAEAERLQASAKWTLDRAGEQLSRLGMAQAHEGFGNAGEELARLREQTGPRLERLRGGTPRVYEGLSDPFAELGLLAAQEAKKLEAAAKGELDHAKEHLERLQVAGLGMAHELTAEESSRLQANAKWRLDRAGKLLERLRKDASLHIIFHEELLGSEEAERLRQVAKRTMDRAAEHLERLREEGREITIALGKPGKRHGDSKEPTTLRPLLVLGAGMALAFGLVGYLTTRSRCKPPWPPRGGSHGGFAGSEAPLGPSAAGNARSPRGGA